MGREFENEYKQLGLKVAYYRKLRGLTQQQLAEKIGIESTSYIGSIESTKTYKPISLGTLFRIARALDTPPHKFLEF